MRNYSLDILKFICAITVVIIHCPIPANIRLFTTGLESCAVPLFFMMSGYFTFNRNNLQSTLAKRTKSILKLSTIALLAYTFLFYIKTYEIESLRITHIQVWDFIGLNQPPFGKHLWYLFAYSYILVIIKYIDKYNLYKPLFYTIIPLLITGLCIGKYSGLVLGETKESIISRNFLFTGLPFFTIGMWIRKITHDRAITLNSKKIFAALILTYIISFIESTTLNVRNGLGDLYITTVPLSILIMMLCLSIKKSNDNFFSRAGREYGLYIYIVHYAVISDILYKKSMEHNWGMDVNEIVFPPAAITLTAAIIFILKKTRFIGKVI